MIEAYYKFISLPDEVKEAHKIRSKARLDCVSYTNQPFSNGHGLTNFVNAKGQIVFYKTPAQSLINAHSKRIADWTLTNNNLNFSSIYIEDIDFPEIAFGFPNAKRFLKNGNPNPLYPFKNDGYLFLINRDYSIIELFVLTDGRNLINLYYQKMIDGDFEKEIKELRNRAKPFFDYGL